MQTATDAILALCKLHRRKNVGRLLRRKTRKIAGGTNEALRMESLETIPGATDTSFDATDLFQGKQN
ncbi:MAG TPA: hypothetical protein VGY56_07785 [Verrucomicrobiae bacterium]|nr:hypothetical protein [Verrucomicrobiae bacterium]